jgi:hypothetical protein
MKTISWFICFILLASNLLTANSIDKSKPISNPLISLYGVNARTGLSSIENQEILFSEKDSKGRVIIQKLLDDKIIANYSYGKDVTEVMYPYLNQKNIFRFSPETHQLISFETYLLDPNQDEWNLVTKESYSYTYGSHGILSILRTLEDNTGNILAEYYLDRDSKGHLIAETLINHQNPEQEYQTVYHSPKQDDSNSFIKQMVTPLNIPNGQGEAIADGMVFSEKFDALGKVFFGDTLFRYASHTAPPRTGVFGSPKPKDNLRITYINGILNHEAELQEALQLISRGHEQEVHFVYRGTQAWNNDNNLCVLVKYGYITEHARRLAALWKRLIYEIGGVEGDGKIIHYAHSIGGAETACARTLLTPEEQKKIVCIVFGSPVSIRNDEGFSKSINYVLKRDLIPFLSLDTLWALVDSASVPHVVFIGYLGEFCLEHGFSTYWSYWQEHAKKDMDMTIKKHTQ